MSASNFRRRSGSGDESPFVERALERVSFRRNRSVAFSPDVIAVLDSGAEQARRISQRRRHAVTMVIGSLGPGGAERQLCNLATGVIECSNWEVAVRSTDPLRGRSAFFAKALEAHHIVPKRARPVLPGRRWCADAHFFGTSFGYTLESLYRDFTSHRPAVVHAWLDRVNVAAGIAAVLSGVPRIILSGRNVNPSRLPGYSHYLRDAYMWLIAQPGVTLTNNSAAGAVDYASWLELDPSRIPVVLNGYRWADLGHCQSPCSVTTERDTQRPLVLGVLRLSPEKRPLLWLETARRIAQARPDVDFAVIGDGPLRIQCQDFVRACSLGDRIALLGTRGDVYEWMDAADVLLLTSSEEGLPNVLVEAQSLGTPVLTTPAGGAPETLLDGVTGRVLRVDSADQLAREILQVLGNPDWLTRASDTGRAWVRERFGLDRMVKEWLDLYER